MKFNFKEISQYAMLVLITVMQFVQLSPEQKKEYVKVAFETLDSLNTKFAVRIESDSTIKNDTIVVPAIDTTKK